MRNDLQQFLSSMPGTYFRLRQVSLSAGHRRSQAGKMMAATVSPLGGCGHRDLIAARRRDCGRRRLYHQEPIRPKKSIAYAASQYPHHYRGDLYLLRLLRDSETGKAGDVGGRCDRFD